MRGIAKVETLEVFERFADGLNMPDHVRIALGLAPKTAPAAADPAAARAERTEPGIPSRDTHPALPAASVSGLLSADAGDSKGDEPSVRRRTFVGLTGASLFGAILADTARSGPADAIESFAAVLAAYSSDTADTADAALGSPPDLPALAATVAQAKRDYQACRYSAVTKDLPALLTRLQAACAVLDDQWRLQAYTLSAEAHHVAASILLKVGDQGLGWLAADRSMQAAQASEDPVTIASSGPHRHPRHDEQQALQGGNRHGQLAGGQVRPGYVLP